MSQSNTARLHDDYNAGCLNMCCCFFCRSQPLHEEKERKNLERKNESEKKKANIFFSEI